MSLSAAQVYTGGYATRNTTVAARLAPLIGALSEAQHLADSNDLDGRVRVELHNALDHIRHTASVVEQWFEAHAKSADAYAVLPILATQRVHRAAQLARDLSLDLENMEVTLETEGLQDLSKAIGQLNRQLEVLCRPRQ